MGYSTKGRKPIERASKIAHTEIIKNPEVQAYVDQCFIPNPPENSEVKTLIRPLPQVNTSHISAVIAIDGGYTETFVRDDFPSASIVFYTFGPLLFELGDLRALDRKRFVAPEDLARLKNIERYTLVLPVKNIRRNDQASLAATIRKTIHEFFLKPRGAEGEKLIDSLKWFLFRRWNKAIKEDFSMSFEGCPYSECEDGGLSFKFSDPDQKTCPTCSRAVFLTDIFRLHERIDEEQGAGAIIAYVLTMLEQMVLVHLVHGILEKLKPSLLRNLLFIKDGPLAFFGLVAPLYKPMRELMSWLLSDPSGSHGPTIHLVGLEKSGAFVEHAGMIQEKMDPSSYLLLGDKYIRKFIVPGAPGGAVYGQNTYYGQKMIFRAGTGEMYVATMPAKTFKAEPVPEEIPHMHEIMSLLSELRCSMYDNALIPVALANKLVSLSDFPSQRILTTFAKSKITLPKV